MRIEIDTHRLHHLMQEQRLSQTELAKRSGLSRQTLIRLLKRKKARVQLATEQKLATALGLKQGTLDVQGPGTAYRDRLAEQHEYLDFAGLGVVTLEQPVPVDKGFASLKVEAWRPEENEDRDERCRKMEGRLRIDREPKTMMDGLTIGGALQRCKRFFLLGDPGTGKTTASRHIARSYAQRRQAKNGYPNKAVTPILVRLADWADQLQADETADLLGAALGQMSLFDAIESAEWLKEQVQNQKVLVLLDGLDEVADPKVRGSMLDKIRSFVEAYPKANYVVTSRIVGFEKPNLGKRFDVLRLMPLTTKATRQFARQWFAFRHKHDFKRTCVDCTRHLARLQQSLEGHPQIRAIAANPMMLTILLLLFEAGTSLPQRRWDLYRRISEAFLSSWEEKKRGALNSAPDRLMDLENREVLWILESLAWEMQRRDWTLASRWWLSHHVSSFLREELGYGLEKARREADTLIWSLRERSTVLKERGPERYGFSHLAFQEYFAARAALAETDPIAAIRPFIYHPRWREVVRLVAAQLNRRKATDLLRVVLDDPDPTGRFLERGLLLSLACLADGAFVHDTDLLGEMGEKAVRLGKSKWLGIAREALESLALLRDTRLGAFASGTVTGMLRTAQEVLDESEHKHLLWWAATEGFIDFPEPEAVADDSGEQDPRPVTERQIIIEGKTFHTLKVRIPDRISPKWGRAVVVQLGQDPSPRVRAACARELGRFVETRPSTVRDALVEALVSEKDPSVRETIAGTLAPVADRPKMRDGLLERLKDDPSGDVRGECARALEVEACNAPSVRRTLAGILDSQASPKVRSGAARGLAGAAGKDRDTLLRLRARLGDPEEHDRVRACSLWALEDVLPTLPDGSRVLRELVDSGQGSVVARVAAILVSRYAKTDKVRWEDLPTRSAEQLLVSLENPCPHALDALVSLVETRELKNLGIPREARIARALSSFQDRIRLSFVFGSTARREQRSDSDIDLIIIGNASLEDVAPGLREVEQELGKQVNAVIYSEEEWRERSHEGNPFVKEVVEGEKLFVLGGENELAAMG